MGAASYHEDDLQRFLEARDKAWPALSGPLAPMFECPFCSERFEERRLLTSHLSATHRGERPALLICGREPEHTTVLRQSLQPGQVLVANCTEARIRRHGGAFQEAGWDVIAARVAAAIDDDIELELLNRFDPVAAPIAQRYHLHIRVPDKPTLDEVDRAFLKHLTTDPPRMSQVADFLSDTSSYGIGSEYADALGKFVTGVLVKDQAFNAGVTLPPSEASALYGAALEVLRHFGRPLSSVICGLIRFSLNEFTHARFPTGFVRLDRANAQLAPLIGQSAPTIEATRETRSAKHVRLCPIDHASDSVIDLADQLSRQTRWGPTLHETCQKSAMIGTLTGPDRIKIYALWAKAALRLGAEEAAREPLRRLRANYPFGDWAESELRRLGD